MPLLPSAVEVLPLLRAMAIALVVERVVGVPEEVPTADVVDVAVAVVVLAVREDDDQVLGIEQPVAVRVAVATGVAGALVVVDARVGDGRDQRLVVSPAGGEVEHVEDAVAVAVVSRTHRAVRLLRQRQLALVQVELVHQIGVLPEDAAVVARDDHPRIARRHRPGHVLRHAGPLHRRALEGQQRLREAPREHAGIAARVVGIGRVEAPEIPAAALGPQHHLALVRAARADPRGHVAEAWIVRPIRRQRQVGARGVRVGPGRIHRRRAQRGEQQHGGGDDMEAHSGSEQDERLAAAGSWREAASMSKPRALTVTLPRGTREER